MFADFQPGLALFVAVAAFFLVMRTRMDRKSALAYIAFVGVLFLFALTPGQEPLSDKLSTSNYILPAVAAYGAWAVPSYALSGKDEHRHSHMALMGLLALVVSLFVVVYIYGHFSNFVGNIG